MGFLSFMENRAQQEILKRAMEAGWTASTCGGMVFGPLLMLMETGGANRQAVRGLIDNWLAAWQNVRYLSDRNLHRNREWHAVRPNEVLSPILARFEQELVSFRSDNTLDGQALLARVKEEMNGMVQELFEFNEWTISRGPRVGLDASKYEPKAVRRGKKYWASTIREFTS